MKSFFPHVKSITITNIKTKWRPFWKAILRYDAVRQYLHRDLCWCIQFADKLCLPCSTACSMNLSFLEDSSLRCLYSTKLWFWSVSRGYWCTKAD